MIIVQNFDAASLLSSEAEHWSCKPGVESSILSGGIVGTSNGTFTRCSQNYKDWYKDFACAFLFLVLYISFMVRPGLNRHKAAGIQSSDL